MNPSLHIDVDEIENKVILRLDGRLDAATTPVLERKINRLIEDKHYLIYVDFLRIDYLSSAGMRLLLSVSKKLKTQKGALVLFSIDDEVMEIIKLAGFERILQIFASEQDALQYMP